MENGEEDEESLRQGDSRRNLRREPQADRGLVLETSWRVTKYDPAKRDPDGAYRVEDWTAISDIGRVYAGVPLTAEAYARAEDAYVATILSFVKEAGGQLLRVVGLESRDTAEALDAMVGFGLPIECVPLREGQTISLSELGVVARMLLRELAWCCLESETTRAHFGYDFYLYLAADRPCPASAALAARSGLFVEPCDSPYAEESS